MVTSVGTVEGCVEGAWGLQLVKGDGGSVFGHQVVGVVQVEEEPLCDVVESIGGCCWKWEDEVPVLEDGENVGVDDDDGCCEWESELSPFL
jgi:hypothetical protein